MSYDVHILLLCCRARRVMPVHKGLKRAKAGRIPLAAMKLVSKVSRLRDPRCVAQEIMMPAPLARTRSFCSRPSCAQPPNCCCRTEKDLKTLQDAVTLFEKMFESLAVGSDALPRAPQPCSFPARLRYPLYDSFRLIPQVRRRRPLSTCTMKSSFAFYIRIVVDAQYISTRI